MRWLALDIGGANLKSADGRGFANSLGFALWKRPAELAEGLRELIGQSPAAEHFAVTITGELADCYQTKAEGIHSILYALESLTDGRQVVVYLCNGEFCTPTEAREKTLLASASNWHVLGSFVAQLCGELPAVLIDIGSTTTDIIPLGPNGVEAVGMTDPERLATGELVYTGIERSPICAVTQSLSWRGERCGVAQELFATTADAYVVLGDVDEDPHNTDTADGRPLTKSHAHARLARMICADTTMFDWEDARRIASEIQKAQLNLLQRGFLQVVDRMEIKPRTIVLSGHGEFLARRLVQQLEPDVELVSLSTTLGSALSRCAPAHALAVLARERFSDHG